jgi:hypothetical protein
MAHNAKSSPLVVGRQKTLPEAQAYSRWDTGKNAGVLPSADAPPFINSGLFGIHQRRRMLFFFPLLPR